MLKGPPLSILLVLAHSTQPLTGRDLVKATGYTDKPIKEALTWLARNRQVRSLGRTKGWVLGPNPPSFLKPIPITPEAAGQRRHAGQVSADNRPTSGADQFPRDAGNMPQATSASEYVRRERNEPVNYGSVPQADERSPQVDQMPRKRARTATRKNSDHRDRRFSDFTDVDRSFSDFTDVDRSFSDPRSENFRSSADLISDDLNYSFSDDDDGSTSSSDQQIRNRQQEKKEKNMVDRNNSPFKRLLSRLHIRNPAYSRILQDNEPAELLAWYWEGLQNKRLADPIAWTISRLGTNEEPDPGLLEIAAVWLRMARHERHLTAGASRWEGVPSFWFQEDLSDAGLEAVSAVMRAGGFKKVY